MRFVFALSFALAFIFLLSGVLADVERHVEDLGDLKKIVLDTQTSSNKFVIDEAFSDGCNVSEDGIEPEILVFRSNWHEGIWVLIDNSSLNVEMYYIINADCVIDADASISGEDIESYDYVSEGGGSSGRSGSSGGGSSGSASSQGTSENSNENAQSNQNLEEPENSQGLSEDILGISSDKIRLIWFLLIIALIIACLGIVIYLFVRKRKESESSIDNVQINL